MRFSAHIFFGFGLLPWLLALPVSFMAFGAPGLEDNPFVSVALISYTSYPVLYVSSLVASYAFASTEQPRWANRIAFAPLLSPVLFVISYIAVAATA